MDALAHRRTQAREPQRVVCRVCLKMPKPNADGFRLEQDGWLFPPGASVSGRCRYDPGPIMSNGSASRGPLSKVELVSLTGKLWVEGEALDVLASEDLKGQKNQDDGFKLNSMGDGQKMFHEWMWDELGGLGLLEMRQL